MRTGLIALLSTLEVVGEPFTVLVQDFLPSLRLRRLEEGFRWVRDDVIMLQAAIDDHVVLTDQFGELFERTASGIAKSASERKRRAFAAVLARGLVEPNADHERRMYFVDLLERCRDVHLIVLALLAGDRSRDDRTIREILGDEVDVANLAGGDLFAWGLRWVDDSLQADRKLSEWAAAGLTPLGEEFALFIRSPSAEHQ